MYVADTGNQRIEKFNRDGQFLTSWGSRGNGPGQFGQQNTGLNLSGPNYLAIDSTGNVYASDDANGRIEKFDSNGRYLFEFPTQYPGGLALDSQDRLYVGSADGLTEYDQNGKMLADFGGSNANPAATGLSALAFDKKTSILYMAQTVSKTVYRVQQR